jgi:hypothetical protein
MACIGEIAIHRYVLARAETSHCKGLHVASEGSSMGLWERGMRGGTRLPRRLNAEGQRSRWLVRSYFADLRASPACATTLRRGVQSTECSMSSYPVHRSIPPTRRSSSDGNLVPGVAWGKPLNCYSTLEIQAVFLLLCLGLLQAVRSTSVDVVPLALNAATTEPPSRRSSNTSAPYSRE